MQDQDGEATRYFQEVARRINNPVTFNAYELGTEKYSGYQYPAILATLTNFVRAINTTIGLDDYYTYAQSVHQGVNELQSYIAQRHTKYKESETLYVLGGYSQGAQVIGQALPKINKNIRDDIVYVGLFGDPKLHYPEGEGLLPVACLGERSAWRRVPTFNCLHDNGSLGSRKPYLPGDMHAKTGLWCYRDDFICDPGSFSNSGHGEYKKPGMAIDHAAQIATTRLQARLKQDNPPPPPPLPWEPTPEPPINYDQALNVHRVFNQGTTGENVVFAVDVSESMRHKLPIIKQHLRDTIPKILNRGGKVAFAVYWGVYDNQGTYQHVAGYGIPFDQDPLPYIEQLDSPAQPEYTTPGSPIEMIYHTLGLPWTYGATKSITIFTNNLDPIRDHPLYPPYVDMVVQKALAIDPVNIYPVVPEKLKDYYAEVAEKTSGQVLTYTDDIASAANQAFEKITKRPVPFLGNTEYMAEPGQEVTFDASDSYVLDGSITKYDWDYDGDGQFEASTTAPLIKHTYNSPFTGLMQVRVTADNGTLANMSAQVTIGEITPPTLPAAPQNLTHTITSTADNKSTVTITWDGNTEAHAWFIQINDMPMGYVQAGQTSLEITDIERSEDVIIGVASAVGTSANSFSNSTFSTTTVPKIPPPTPEPEPPVTSTCTQSNFFVRLFCKAIAIFKYYLNGIWYYILPHVV